VALQPEPLSHEYLKLLGDCLADQSNALLHLKRPREGIMPAKRSVDCYDRAQEPGCVAGSIHQLALACHHAERYEDALRLLGRAGPVKTADFARLLTGSAAALGGKGADNLVMRATDIAYAFPDLLLIILLQSIFGGGLWQTIVAIALVAWTGIARLVRGQMLSLKQTDYALAARTLGASQTRIVFLHILPNTLGPGIVARTFAIPSAIFAEAVLTFIGIGLPPPTASLGRLINDGYEYIQVNAWIVTFPALAIGLLMLSFTFIGDGLLTIDGEFHRRSRRIMLPAFHHEAIAAALAGSPDGVEIGRYMPERHGAEVG